MFVNKLINMMLMAISFVCNSYSTEVCFEFKPNDEYHVKCGSDCTIFDSTKDLSSGLNSFTGIYFNVTSVENNNSTVTFNGISNTEPCNVLVKGSAMFIPALVFNCENNNVRISKLSVGANISSMSFNSLAKDKVQIDSIDNFISAHVKINGPILVREFSINAGAAINFTGGSRVVMG